MTDEQLRAAWLVCKLRTWPATFEEAMADAQYSRLVRLNARRIDQPCKPAPLDPYGRWAALTTRPRFAPPPPGWVDHKRAAAGDRDDD